jgi:hypothetical protein
MQEQEYPKFSRGKEPRAVYENTPAVEEINCGGYKTVTV